jgi:hypothetical protein
MGAQGPVSFVIAVKGLKEVVFHGSWFSSLQQSEESDAPLRFLLYCLKKYWMKDERVEDEIT